jgi:hypothetical protein
VPALTVPIASGAALVAIAVVVGLGVLAAMVVRAIVGKLLTIAVLALIAIAVWSQRASLQHCADLVREAAGDPSAATCSFFGHDVEVPV